MMGPSADNGNQRRLNLLRIFIFFLYSPLPPDALFAFSAFV